jgi:hypothetical protein
MESGEVVKVMDKVKSQNGVSFGRDVEFECVAKHVEKEIGKCLFIYFMCLEIYVEITFDPGLAN